MAGSHQVGKLVLEMTVPGQDGVNEKQDRALETIERKLLPAIERAFDKFDKPGFIIHIDRLELDLSGQPFSSIDTDFVEEFKKKLDDALSGLLSVNASAGSSQTIQVNSQPVSFTAVLENSFDSEGGRVFFNDKGERAEIRTKETDQTELLFFYLKNGYLPWYAQSEEKISVEKIATDLLQSNSPLFVSELRNEFRTPSVVKRLASQFSISLLQKVISVIFPSDNPLHFFGEMKWETSTRAGRNFLENIFSFSAGQPVSGSGKIFISETFSNCDSEHGFIVKEFFLVFPKENNFYADIIRSVAVSPSLTPVQKSELFYKRIGSHPLLENKKQIEELVAGGGEKEWSRPENKKEWPTGDETKNNIEKKEEKEKTPAPKKENKFPDSKNKKEKVPGRQQEKKPAEKKEDEISISEEDSAKRHSDNKKITEAILRKIESEINYDAVPGEAIYIKNAGLVIVQPFLQSFFSELKLLSGKEFSNEPAQHKAVYILNYLATGNIEPPEEHELVLEKLLCGMGITEVLGPYEPLTAIEIEESESLLNSVIEHWGALKKSSPAGLRQAFIEREGKLFHDSNGWTLRVERNAFDVLLSKLPWGISIVKSAWQREILFVEW